MRLLGNNRVIYTILALGFIAGVIVIFFTNMSYGGGDSTQHYNLARWGWEHHKLLFSHWGKPVFTLLMSPLAQFGIDGARIYNLLTGFATAIVIWKIAIHLKYKNSALSLILVLFTPVYFVLMFAPLTEVTYSFFVSLSILLFLKKKYFFSAIVLSFTPLIRTEGIVILPLFILAYSLKRKILAIPLLSVGFLIISLLGYQYYDDMWWLITKMPYSGSAKAIYGSGSIFHFINPKIAILGYPLGMFFLLGLLLLIFKWVKEDRFDLSENFYFLLLISGSYIVFLSAHSFVWWQGMGNSLGLTRVIGSVTPLAALTALYGFDFSINYIFEKNKYISFIFKYGILVWIIIIGQSTYKYGFKLSRPQLLVKQSASYIIDNNLDKYKLYYFDPFVVFSLDVDPYDKNRYNWGVSNKEVPSMGMPDSSIIVWDAHFGPNEGRLPLSRLKGSNELSLLKVVRPTQPFKVLGGYDYAVYIFQKILKRNDSVENGTLLEAKEFTFEFEELENDSVSYSGNRSFRVTSGKEYFGLLNHNLSELTDSLSSLKVDFSAAFLLKEEISNDEVILVCTLVNDEETILYQAINLFKQVKNIDEWNKLQHTFNIYVVSSLQENIKLYLWNKSKTTFNIDEVKIIVTTFDSQKE